MFFDKSLMDEKIEKCGNKSCRRYSEDMPNNCWFTPYIKYCIEHKLISNVGNIMGKKDIKFEEKELIEAIKKVTLEKDDILLFQFTNLTKEASDDIYNMLAFRPKWEDLSIQMTLLNRMNKDYHNEVFGQSPVT